jgi:hypothetical protein
MPGPSEIKNKISLVFKPAYHCFFSSLELTFLTFSPAKGHGICDLVGHAWRRLRGGEHGSLAQDVDRRGGGSGTCDQDGRATVSV